MSTQDWYDNEFGGDERREDLERLAVEIRGRFSTTAFAGGAASVCQSAIQISAVDGSPATLVVCLGVNRSRLTVPLAEVVEQVVRTVREASLACEVPLPQLVVQT